MAHVTDQLNTALADRYVLERELGQGGVATGYPAPSGSSWHEVSGPACGPPRR
jgi:hypothetical protein